MYLGILSIILLLCVYFTDAFFLHRLQISNRFTSQDQNHKALCEEAVNHTIEVPLDHFDEHEKRMWPMIYYERLDLWKKDGPIYLYINGEGSASCGDLTSGLMCQLAEETNGAMFMSEHRYYGTTNPVPNFNIENMKYLSSRQALADLAELLKYIKSLPQYKKSKVVVVGGSYAGNLSAWMRLLYPDLVDAAIASSAPVLAKKDFYEYLETVADDFKEYGTPGCYDKIAAKFNRYDQLFKTSVGIDQLKKEENICNSTDMTKPENMQWFFEVKTEDFMSVAQYGTPESILTSCNTSNNVEIDVQASTSNRFLRKFNLWNEDEMCDEYDFYSMLNSLISTEDYAMRWIYQTCTEFGYFQTTSSDKQPFTKNIPVDLSYKMCTTLFGPQFNEKKIDEGVSNTNKMYGGLKPNVTRVVFVNGDMDPWHRLGILEDISTDAPAKLVHGTSHCRDLRADSLDPKEMQETIKYVKDMIKKWIGAGKYKK